MNTIIIRRPKEKVYDESKLKVYVNNIFIGKLKQNSTLELKTEEPSIEIQAKTFEFASRKEKFEALENIELEIMRTHRVRPPLSILWLYPAFFTILFGFGVPWLRKLVIVLTIIVVAWIGYLYFTHRNDEIVIRKAL